MSSSDWIKHFQDMSLGKIHPNKQGQWWLKRDYNTENRGQCQNPIQIVSPTQQAVEQAKAKQGKRKYTSQQQPKSKRRKISQEQKSKRRKISSNKNRKTIKYTAGRNSTHKRKGRGPVNNQRKQSTPKRPQDKNKKPSAAKKKKFANLRHIYNGRS